MSITTSSSPTSSDKLKVPAKQLVVQMGGMLVSNDAAVQLVTYALGSCVGVAIYDPVAKVGGLLHAMMPDSAINWERAQASPAMFVDTGIPAMFHAAYALGGVKARMIVKLCGGSAYLDDRKTFNIGQRNVEAVLDLLQRNGVRVTASDTGDCKSRTVRLDIGDGLLTLDIAGEQRRQL